MARPQQRAGRGRAPSRRGLAVAGVGLAVVLAIAGIALGLRGGSSQSAATADSQTTTSADALPQAGEVEGLYNGISQQGNQLGDPNAPAAMIEYVDIQCPYCAQFETEAMPSLIRDYVRPGKVFLEIRPIASLGKESERGRRAMVAAGLQGKFFQLGHLLYLNQGAENSGWLTDDLLRSAVASIGGLDAARFFEDLETPSVGRQGDTFDAQARTAAIAVTPTIFVGKNGGSLRQVTPAFPSDDRTIARAIDAAQS